jgi:energy-converting hydrogenase Eha subunit A
MNENRFPWQFAIAFPVALVALGFMVYTLRFFKMQHVLVVLTMICDVAFLTILFTVASKALFDPEKRSSLVDFKSSRKPIMVLSIMIGLVVVSLYVHLFCGLPILNSVDYLYIVFIPLLLVIMNRFF